MVRSVSSARVSSLSRRRPPGPRGGTRRSRPGRSACSCSDVVHPPVQVEADHVLDVLPAADQAARGCRPWRCRRPRRPRGSRERLHQPADASGSKTVSPSTMTIGRARAQRDAGVERGRLAARWPAGSPVRRAAAAPRRSSAVPSVEPSSTTITSTRVVAGRPASGRWPRCPPPRCRRARSPRPVR